MVLDNAPWERPETVKPAPPPVASSGLADVERYMALAEGFMDRLWPKAQKFLEGVQAAKDGRKMVEPEPREISPPQPLGIDAESIYGMVFDLLNSIPDEMTCGDMRTQIRNNKAAILPIIQARLNERHA